MLESRQLERAIAAVRRRVEDAATRGGRDPGEVRIVAATKKVAPDVIRSAAAAGLDDFGENYVQELERKREAAPEAVWHLIGRLQRNKAARVVGLADVVQTLEPGPAAERLAAASAERDDTIDALVEVDFTGRRVGVGPEDVDRFVERATGWKGLRVVGLMTVPPLGEPPRRYFRELRDMRDRLNERFETMTELSMGMSSDYEDAVEEGATMVRIGTAIFGPRA